MTQQLAEYQQAQELALPDRMYLERELNAVREFQALAQQLLVSGQDYGVIPGTNKPTLLKPGAEKIAKLLGLADRYEIVDKTEDWDRPLFRYLVRCQLTSVRTNVVVSESFGECNTMESRYRWRNRERVCPECGAEAIIKGRPEYGGGFVCFKRKGGCGAKFADDSSAILDQPIGRVENDDVYTLVNTVLKMAQKRALVGAALSAGRLSEVFTQDMEDIVRGAMDGGTETSEPQPTKPAARLAPAKPTPAKPTPARTVQTPSFGPQVIAVANSLGWDDEELGAWLKEHNFISEGKLVHGDVALTEIQRYHLPTLLAAI